MRILVAEDEKDLNRLISEALEEAGYSVDRCYDGGEALDFIDCAEYDAAVLDVLMPVKSGRDVVREMRARGISTPVLFLTALDGIDDRVAGLDDGADDYLVKPFAFPELLARLRAITRKYAKVKSTRLTAGDLTLDTANHTVTRGLDDKGAGINAAPPLRQGARHRVVHGAHAHRDRGSARRRHNARRRAL